MKSIGEWLKQKRLEAGLDLRQLAKIAVTNQGQISRIETGKSELTLSTLVLMSWALNLNPDELISTFSLPKLISRQLTAEQKGSNYEGTVTRENIVDFLAKFEYDLPSLIKSVTQCFIPVLKKANTNILKTDNLQESIKAAVVDGKLLPSPPALTSTQLYNYYVNHSTITMADAGLNLRLWRQQKKLVLQDITNQSGVNTSTINRLETNINDRISLTAAISLDQALMADGQIFSLFWSASEFQMGIFPGREKRYRWTEKQVNLIDTYVKLARWVHVYDPPKSAFFAVPYEPELNIPPMPDPAEKFKSLGASDELAEEIRESIAYQNIDGMSVATLANEIQYKLIGGFARFMEDKVSIPSHSSELETAYKTWSIIKKHVGNDAFGKRAMQIYMKHSFDEAYAVFFNVFLRELLMADYGFFQKIKGLLIEEKKRTGTETSIELERVFEYLKQQEQDKK